MRAAMSRIRASFVAILTGSLITLLAQPVFAQPKPTPKPKPGICAPWHRCFAQATIGLIVLFVLFTIAMYAYQRRGFSTVEHKQGSPDGVPTKRAP